MLFRKLFTLGLSSFCCLVLAQPPEVVSASGGSFADNTMSISYTIGECMTGIHHSGGEFLGEGFHTLVFASGKIVSTGILPESAMSVYPNPVEDVLHIRVEDPLGFRYSLHDVKGSLIENGVVLDELTEIHLGTLYPGVYILRIYKENDELRIFQIVKH